MSRIESYSGERITFLGESIDGGFAPVRSKVTTVRRRGTILA